MFSRTLLSKPRGGIERRYSPHALRHDFATPHRSRILLPELRFAQRPGERSSGWDSRLDVTALERDTSHFPHYATEGLASIYSQSERRDYANPAENRHPALALGRPQDSSPMVHRWFTAENEVLR